MPVVSPPHSHSGYLYRVTCVRLDLASQVDLPGSDLGTCYGPMWPQAKLAIMGSGWSACARAVCEATVWVTSQIQAEFFVGGVPAVSVPQLPRLEFSTWFPGSLGYFLGWLVGSLALFVLAAATAALP